MVRKVIIAALVASVAASSAFAAGHGGSTPQGNMLNDDLSVINNNGYEVTIINPLYDSSAIKVKIKKVEKDLRKLKKDKGTCIGVTAVTVPFGAIICAVEFDKKIKKVKKRLGELKRDLNNSSILNTLNNNHRVKK